MSNRRKLVITDLNLSESISEVGQHIGFAGVTEAKAQVRGNRLKGTNLGKVVNLDGENINPDIPAVRQSFVGERMRIHQR